MRRLQLRLEAEFCAFNRSLLLMQLQGSPGDPLCRILLTVQRLQCSVWSPGCMKSVWKLE